MAKELKKLAEKKSVVLYKIAAVVKEEIRIGEEKITVRELQNLNEAVFENKF
jgi:hypothetical protein